MRKLAIVTALAVLATSSGCSEILSVMGLKAYPIGSVIQWMLGGFSGLL